MAQDNAELEQKSRVFVIKFDGNISASAVTNLREEISAVLSASRPVMMRWWSNLKALVVWFIPMA